MSASQTIKKLFAEAIKANEGMHVSLKNFVKSLNGENGKVAQQWLSNKNGDLERKAKQMRLKNKATMLSEMRTAKKSQKSGNSKK